MSSLLLAFARIRLVGLLFEVTGLIIREEHSIAEIQGNRIRLNAPLHARVNHSI